MESLPKNTFSHSVVISCFYSLVPSLLGARPNVTSPARSISAITPGNGVVVFSRFLTSLLLYNSEFMTVIQCDHMADSLGTNTTFCLFLFQVLNLFKLLSFSSQ